MLVDRVVVDRVVVDRVVVGRVAARVAFIPKNQRPCRNVALHGYCKFAGKGCEYSHEACVSLLSWQYHQLVLLGLPSLITYQSLSLSNRSIHCTRGCRFPMMCRQSICHQHRQALLHRVRRLLVD
jgi:hypothetical protein